MKATITGLLFAATLPLHAALVVSGGYLVIEGDSLVNSGDSEIQTGATIAMGDTADITANTLTIDAGGTLVGCGLVFADIINNGEIIANCGSTMTLLGDVTNHSLIRAVNSTTFSADTGLFTNNGTLDILTGSGGAPANLTGVGTFISAGTPPAITFSVDTILDRTEIAIQTNTYHQYILETRYILTSGNWAQTNSFTGDGSLLTWQINGVLGSQYFRVKITD